MIDSKLEFSDAQEFTTAEAHDSENILDLGIADPNKGAGTPVFVDAHVNTDFASDGSATLKTELQHCDTVDGSYSTLISSGEIAVDDLVAGKALLDDVLPKEHKRFLKIVYTVGTAAMTAGAVDAMLRLERIARSQ